MTAPATSCTGTSQDFRLPNRLLKTASTMGAHSSLRLNGHEHRAKMACALYAVLVSSAREWG